MANPTSRVLIVSERGFRSIVPMSYYYEYEDVIASIDHVDLIAPAPRAANRNEGGSWFYRLKRHVGWQLERTTRLQEIELEHDYDLLFVIGPFLRHHMQALKRVEGWQRRCRVKVADIHELWALHLEDESDWVRRQWTQFDHIMVGFPGSVEVASRFFGQTCHCLPGAVDVLRFCPPEEVSPARVIDVMNIGRRDAAAHEAFLKWARRTGRFYEYDSIGAGEMKDHVAHRERLAGLLQRSQYFIANQAQFNNKAKRGDQEEIGLRHFEGAAAGAVLVGQPPDSPSTNLQFGWEDAIIPVASDSPDVIDVIEQLDREPDRVEQIRRRNMRESLRRHDWSHRWQQVLELADLPLTPKHEQRLEEMERRAKQLD